MNCLGLERLALAAISAGHCFKITEYARDYARERIQFGQPISQFQVIQHKLADMQIMSETARQMVYRVADLLDMGQPVVTEASIAKLWPLRTTSSALIWVCRSWAAQAIPTSTTCRCSSATRVLDLLVVEPTKFNATSSLKDGALILFLSEVGLALLGLGVGVC